MQEIEYFGTKIVYYNTSKTYIGYIVNRDGTQHNVKAATLDDVREKIDAYKRQYDIENLYNRINKNFGCNRETFDFFFNMFVCFHSCQGAAVLNMQDYCAIKNIY